MGSTKHTPGPWGFRSNYNGSLDFFGDGGARVILCSAFLQNQVANARLIAAAPELLEALRELVEMTEPLIVAADHRSALNFYDNARDAIAKAVGHD